MNSNNITTKDLSISDFHKLLPDTPCHIYQRGELIIIESVTQEEYERSVKEVDRRARLNTCKRNRGNAKFQRKMKRKMKRKLVSK